MPSPSLQRSRWAGSAQSRSGRCWITDLVTARDIEAIYRAESGRVLASLIRLLGGFELAEEALHDAFAAAAAQWPRDGLPKNPRAWLVSAGRFKAIDRLRRKARFDRQVQDELSRRLDEEAEELAEMEEHEVADDQLRLIFTCCHPALPADARVALTLREVCGLTTEEIARAFLTGAPTLAQRIVRAKARIKDLKLPYEVPAIADLPERLSAVLKVIYLVFNEGYSNHRMDIADEAIRLGRQIVALMPDGETLGLLALMLLNDSRRAARLGPDGELILHPDQDRALWNRAQIAEGEELVRKALSMQRPGPYALQAAIAALHAADQTDWDEILVFHDLLLRVAPTPVGALNRAVALGFARGFSDGLVAIDAVMSELSAYQPAHAARADFLRRLGHAAEAADAYRRALTLSSSETEKRFLQSRLDEVLNV
jgi:RNA polymerase sigma-70 factor (ECF subfamily)